MLAKVALDQFNIFLEITGNYFRSVMMHGLSEILLATVKSEFEVFIEYCSNQAVQERTLKKLK